MLLRPALLSVLVVLAALTGVAGDAAAQTPAPSAVQPVPQAAQPTASPTQLVPPAAQSPAPANGSLQIVWEVKNRFRLFREERDFKLHADYLRSRSILESEDALAIEGEGRGWARNMFRRLCIDQSGKINQPCNRDGVGEDYLAPSDHAVIIHLAGDAPPDATCTWTFDDGETSAHSSFPCTEPINFRVRYGRTTNASVDVAVSSDPPQHVETQIEVRDFLIAGLGDSIASGEGNPDRPVALSDEGFCFRSYLTSAEYYRPGRAGYTGDKTCTAGSSGGLSAWQKVAAQWSNPACHRSLYSYQFRTALALAVRYEHIAVTFLPLACSGATIDSGLLGSQRGRECIFSGNAINCQGTVNAQVTQLGEDLATARKRQPQRQVDLALLTIGANDIGFSGLVADVIVDSGSERTLFRRSGVLWAVSDSQAALQRELPRGFANLRQALRPLVNDDFSRVVFVSYGDPARQDDQPCGNGRDGFDIHPSFNADPTRMANVEGFVHDEFLPALKALATCDGDTLCRGGKERMTFVDRHQQAFTQHSICAHAPTDPVFDRDCFSVKGDSFNADPVTAPTAPLTCNRSAGDFRAYLPRARWLRTANDSYFAAMTYPQGFAASAQPSDIHDAAWGVLSAVYGGAVHPTAEGHAAMADAALPAAINVLGLGGAMSEFSSGVVQQPLPPPTTPTSQQ
jgi:hypothetical protein